MKTFVLCVIFVSIIQVKGAPLTKDQKGKLDSYHKDCLKKSNVNNALVEKACKGEFSDDAAFKDYLFCFSQQIGFQDSSGIIQKDVFERKIGSDVHDKAVLSKLVDQCTGEKDSPQETALSLAKCLHETYPGHFKIFRIYLGVTYMPNEIAQKLFGYYKECASDNLLEERTIESAREDGSLYEDPKYKSYLYCFLKKTGIQNDTGELSKDLFLKKLGTVIDDQALLERLVQKCFVQQDTGEDTALFVSKCLYENSPIHIELFPREIPVPEEIAKKIVQNGRECIKETGVDKNLVKKTRKGEFVDNPLLKEFSFCMSKKAGIMNDAGEIQLNELKQKTLNLIKDARVVEKLVDLCAVAKNSPQETAFYLSQCYHNHSPGHLSITQFGALSEAQEEKRRVLIKECSEETGVPSDIVLKARKGDFVEDPLLKQYLFCISKKSGAMNEAGEFDNDFIRKGLTEIFNSEEAENILGKCAKQQDAPVNSSFESFKCFYNTAPEVSPFY